MMKSKYRSLSGAALMLVIIPIFVGILACMPEHVPLGNPDRAKIDADISGIWIVTGEGDLGSLAVFQPWDKHTWMMTSVILEEGADADWSVYDHESYDGIVELLENEPWGRDGSGIDGLLTYKAWLTKISGEQFLTIDARGLIDEDGSLDSLFTLDYRLIKKSPDEFHVQMINEDYEALKDVPATPRAWQKVIRRNKEDADLYIDNVSKFHRVRPEHTKLFSEIISEAFGIL
jgi:hypothetical protein